MSGECKSCDGVGIIIEPRVGADIFHKRVYCRCQDNIENQERWYLDQDGLWKKVLSRKEFEQGATR